MRLKFIQFYFTDVCHFQKISLDGKSSTEFDFYWNSIPAAIGVLLNLPK